jgi:hypothetical protein
MGVIGVTRKKTYVCGLCLEPEVNGELVGSNFMANWGSVGVLGPLTVHPDLWNKGVAKIYYGVFCKIRYKIYRVV